MSLSTRALLRVCWASAKLARVSPRGSAQKREHARPPVVLPRQVPLTLRGELQEVGGFMLLEEVLSRVDKCKYGVMELRGAQKVVPEDLAALHGYIAKSKRLLLTAKGQVRREKKWDAERDVLGVGHSQSDMKFKVLDWAHANVNLLEKQVDRVVNGEVLAKVEFKPMSFEMFARVQQVSRGRALISSETMGLGDRIIKRIQSGLTVLNHGTAFLFGFGLIYGGLVAFIDDITPEV